MLKAKYVYGTLLSKEQIIRILQENIDEPVRMFPNAYTPFYGKIYSDSFKIAATSWLMSRSYIYTCYGKIDEEQFPNRRIVRLNFVYGLLLMLPAFILGSIICYSIISMQQEIVKGLTSGLTVILMFSLGPAIRMIKTRDRLIELLQLF